MRTFAAKTSMCIVLTMMSIKVILDGWKDMEASNNLFFKLLGCCVSFVLLAPSVYDAALMGYMLMSLEDSEIYNSFVKRVEEDWESEQSVFVVKFCLLIFCFPVAWCRVLVAKGCDCWKTSITGNIVGCVDIIQTLVLFPLTVVVIFSSESELDIFVNMIAVQIFGNLDDTFAKSVTDRRKEVWDDTNRLYLDWEVERKTSITYDDLKERIEKSLPVGKV